MCYYVVPLALPTIIYIEYDVTLHGDKTKYYVRWTLQVQITDRQRGALYALARHAVLED